MTKENLVNFLILFCELDIYCNLYSESHYYRKLQNPIKKLESWNYNLKSQNYPTFASKCYFKIIADKLCVTCESK